MKHQFKPAVLASAIAVTLALGGCGSDQEQPEIVNIFEETGLWCKLPEIVQIASPDSYPLSALEQNTLDAAKNVAKMAAQTEAGDLWDEAAWEADFKYENLDLYNVLGLTLEEKERQVIAKAEAREFQIAQGQDVVRGEGFDEWFEAWFAAVPPASYLGASQRLNRAENATTPEMDGSEICYTPPLSCPNYKVADETGTYDCVIPEQNIIEDAPAAEYIAQDGEAVAYYRDENHVDGEDNTALYEGIVAYTFNSDECNAYVEDSISPGWGEDGGDRLGVDSNYGAYWKFDLVDEPSNCANIIIVDASEPNPNDDDKRISTSDLVMPIGASGDVTLHNLDKTAYADDNFPPNLFNGLLIINQHPFFGAEASSGVASCGWSQTPNDIGVCVGEELVCPENSVAVGVGAEEVASKCVAEFDPETTSLLLRGGFNDWGNADDVNFDASKLAYVGEGQYRVNYSYSDDECEVIEAVEAVEATEDSAAIEAVAGEDCKTSYEFKVADADWSEPTSFGSIKGGDQSAVGTTITMTVGKDIGQNMEVEMVKDRIYQFLVNAANPSAVTLTINEVPADLFPSLMIGEESNNLVYSSDGNYVLEQELTAGNAYTLTVADLGVAMGAPADDNTLPGDTEVALAADGGAFTYTPERDGNHLYVLNLSDSSAPTFKVETPRPFGTEKVYLRGSMNDWGVVDASEINWDLESRTYSVIYALEAEGTHEFKFADANWGPITLGLAQVELSEDADAEEITAKGGDGNNFGVSVDKTSTYKFEISYQTADPVVKVSEAPLYLRGGVTTNDWEFTTEVNQLTLITTDDDPLTGNSAEASQTYSLAVEYAGGAAAFKVADADWGGALGYDYGVELDGTTVELGVALPLTYKGKNIGIDVPAGSYIFAFEDGVTKTLTVTAKEQ
jgi:hypothetical protein